LLVALRCRAGCALSGPLFALFVKDARGPLSG
jgi:hypothetical protein